MTCRTKGKKHILVMACLKCTQNRTEYFRSHEAMYSENEIFPTPQNIESLAHDHGKHLMRCTQCHSLWLIQVEQESPAINFSDHSYLPMGDSTLYALATSVKARVIQEDELQHGL